MRADLRATEKRSFCPIKGQATYFDLHDSEGSLETDLPLSLEAYECSVLERALREAHGDATLAARRLGIGRSTLYRKLARHGIRTGGSRGVPVRRID